MEFEPERAVLGVGPIKGLLDGRRHYRVGAGWYEGRDEGMEEFVVQWGIQTCNVVELDCRTRREFPGKLGKGF